MTAAKEPMGVGNILEQIIATKRAEVQAARARRPLEELRGAVRDLPPARDLHAVLSGPAPRTLHLIAEIKRKSPSAGLIRADFDPVQLGQIYHASRASALSVLTDEPYFDGRLEYVSRVRSAVPLPVLRKDFTIDAYHVYESRVAGADAVLLIGEVLPPSQLRELLELACELGMTSLVEVHERSTLEALLPVVPFPNPYRSLLGINNRNLKIQRTDLATTEQLAPLAGPGTVLVSESGVRTQADVQRLRRAGARALLIGETFMAAADIGAKIDEVMGNLTP
jgi:indole-3-glycerol phosphate synthase